MITVTRWQDLSKHSDTFKIEVMRAIIDEIANTGTREFQLWRPRIGVRTKLFGKFKHEYGVLEVMYDIKHSQNMRIITMRAYIYLGRKRIEAKIQAGIDRTVSIYDAVVQNWLYTYLYHVLQTPSILRKYGPLDMPSKLSNYYPGCEFDPYVVTTYGSRVPGEPLAVTVNAGQQTPPQILSVVEDI